MNINQRINAKGQYCQTNPKGCEINGYSGFINIRLVYKSEAAQPYFSVSPYRWQMDIDNHWLALRRKKESKALV